MDDYKIIMNTFLQADVESTSAPSLFYITI